MRRVTPPLVAMLMVLSLGARAQEQRVKVAIVSDATDFTRPFTVGLYFTIQPEWYLYWKNPGDAGLPIAVMWSLPPGFSAGELEQPTPEKIVHGDIVAYGYYNEVLLRTTIYPTAGYRARRDDVITAKLDWLVCSESCIPGGATVSMKVQPLADAQRSRAAELLTRYNAMFPRPLESLGIKVKGATIVRAEGKNVISIALDGERRAQVTDFFPEPIDEAVIDFRTIRVINGTISLPYTPGGASTTIREVRGLAIVGERGYTLRSSIQLP